MVDVAVLSRPSTRVHAVLPTAALCLAGVAVPALPSMVALACDIALPPRVMLVAYAALALVARRVHPATAVAACVVIVAGDLTTTLARTFHLPAGDLPRLFDVGLGLAFLETQRYAAMTALLAAWMGLMVAVHAHAGLRRQAAHGSPWAMLALAAVVAVVEPRLTRLPHYDHGSTAGPGETFESAVVASRFKEVDREASPGSPPPHVLLVMV
ncbi:MAG TPA: hypothetical protein VEA41_10425, partial [Salinarimonas sp.]|nr:hypothetical protein [Salinarimonas sp.]